MFVWHEHRTVTGIVELLDRDQIHAGERIKQAIMDFHLVCVTKGVWDTNAQRAGLEKNACTSQTLDGTWWNVVEINHH
eukprot:1167287-Rhodomonas_salina.1